MLLIGISGKKQSGKDTVYKFAKDNIKTTVLKFAFADGVKEEVSKATGQTIEVLEQQKDIYRKIYQWWGTEFRRNLFGKDYWVIYLRNKILSDYTIQKDEMNNLGRGVVVFITDVRFLNEALWIKGLGGILIRVNRESPNNKDDHQSEVELDDFPFKYYIENNSTLDKLKQDVHSILVDIRKNLNSYHNIKLTT